MMLNFNFNAPNWASTSIYAGELLIYQVDHRSPWLLSHYSTVTFSDENGDPVFQPLAEKEVEELKEFGVSYAQALFAPSGQRRSSTFRSIPHPQVDALPDDEQGCC